MWLRDSAAQIRPYLIPAREDRGIREYGIAKDLILNTNMRINDIAQAVGYQDTSYFYCKFKQCYGVSPASLREMKKY